MRILVSGSSGLIGGVLVKALREEGHRVGRLVRFDCKEESDVLCDAVAGRFDAGAAEGADAVVNLAGENIAGGRWTASRKSEIRRSRVEGTRFLAESLARLGRPPKTMLCASAIGYYGSGEREVDESSPAGSGFLAEVCRAWEAAADPARERGIRVVQLRFGVVLAREGGMLFRVLTMFRLGLGGRVGSGEQWMSWVTIDDAIGVVRHVLVSEDLRGPVNVVSPEAVRNAYFTLKLGLALRRPTPFTAPAFLLRLTLGEMADEVLLASTRAIPRILLEKGYRFVHPGLDGALSALLGRG